MEQIETQASDLRFLSSRTPAPASLGDTHTHVHTHTHPYDVEAPPTHASGGSGSPEMYEHGDNSALVGGQPGARSSLKRRPDDRTGGASAARQTRSKRNRYISIACNECKRRKIKCNGETPCQRCGNLNLECLYTPNCCSTSFKDSEDFRIINAQLGRLQDELNRLNQTVHSLQAHVRLAPSAAASGLSPSAGPSVAPSETAGGITPSSTSALVATPSLPPGTVFGPQPEPEPAPNARFKGSTSAAYCLDVATATMSRMGWKTTDAVADEPDPPPTRESLPTPVASTGGGSGAGGDPLLDIDQAELARLCQVHAEEFEALHPLIPTKDLVAHIRAIEPVLDALRRQRSPAPINDDRTMQLKIALCTALVVENDGDSQLATRLYESMEPAINRKLTTESPDVSGLQILSTAAGYLFLTSDALRAWRMMGQVIRLCMELGLHRRAGIDRIQSEALRRKATDVFWGAYILERRWAFETGLPFTAQDEDIDPELPMPTFPYSVVMVHFSRLCGKVWRQVTHFGDVLARELRSEEIDRLDRDITAWYEGMPEDLRMADWREKQNELMETNPIVENNWPRRLQRRLQIWTYLRANQIRIWLYIAVLHSATSIMGNIPQAHRVVDIAKDTIQFLMLLNKSALHYRKVYFYQFLGDSIAAVFLACVHAPVRFAGICRAEFYMALDIVKEMSASNIIFERVWRTVRPLKHFAPRLGLAPADDEDPHSSAARGMMGLARAGRRAEMEPEPEPEVPALRSQNYDLWMLMNHSNRQAQGPREQGRSPPQNYSDPGAEFSRIFESYMGAGAGAGYGQPGDGFFSSFPREMF